MKKQQSKHGGKRSGAGRKPVPPDELRDQVFSIRLTSDEMQLLEKADVRQWVREVLVRTAKHKLR